MFWRSVFPLVLVPVALGCTSASALQGRIRATRELLQQADRNGAYVCAPRELALGRSHVDFAERELDEAHARRAEEHAAIADQNARAALRMSPPERCNPRDVVVAPPPPEVIPDPDTDGDGLVDPRDGCPLDPEDRDSYLDDDGCPESDNDADGVADNVDNCRNEPEDPDGFNDQDGCPDSDNDQDTVPDLTDRCPNEAGPVDNQGCPPVFTHIQVTQHGVRFHVEFDFDRATLRPNAAETLNEVVVFLGLEHNRSLRYEVGGHTSSEGSRAHNNRLSQQRAETVRRYLMDHGIDGPRLTSRGYGPSQPVDSNRTPQGREANRRVELNELDASGNLVR